ncbi:MAG: outer membrane protein assembly factor BamE [Deltaproteobacteria bacterium]|jgi:outer membrane protein assembly factor BamE (lipoprotein component of BamABCDE complex)|nr:outer membrane protein assembly factor BamE [Deltaproteobacteria bacterium]
MRHAFLLIALLVSALSGCAGAQKHRADVVNQDADRISVGTVQREIRVGMSGADVVSALGSPNMVTTDDKRRETWVYDKISTERVASSSSGGLWLVLAGVNRSAGASSTTQRTLTIIIKFDEKGLVRDYSYRQSSF